MPGIWPSLGHQSYLLYVNLSMYFIELFCMNTFKHGGISWTQGTTMINEEI